jgi:hypothetical protein
MNFDCRPEDQSCDFTPVSTIRIRAEHAQIGDEVFLVVDGQREIGAAVSATSDQGGDVCMGILATGC